METWYFVTLIGTPQIWLMLTGVLVILYLYLRKRIHLRKKVLIKRVLIIFITSLWLTAGVTFALKYAIPVKRPCTPCTENQSNCNPYCPGDNTFPSGHSAMIFSVFTSMFMVFRKRKFLFLFVIPLFVALSRYMLVVHYPVDILAGSLIGIAIPLIVLKVCEKKI